MNAIRLESARSWAEKIVSELATLCDQCAPGKPMIEIAGSIRRGRPLVNDIDLVLIPTDPEAVRDRVLQAATTTVVINGKTNLVVRLGNGLQIDLFFAHPRKKDLFETRPTNFGSLLLCRTGSREHNIWLIEHAKGMGRTWNPYYGVFDRQGRCLASESEQEIFHVLGLDFVPPENRERG